MPNTGCPMPNAQRATSKAHGPASLPEKERALPHALHEYGILKGEEDYWWERTTAMKDTQTHKPETVGVRARVFASSNEALLSEIAERKRVEQALSESEARFKSAFTSTSLGVLLVSSEGFFLQANQAACEVLGYSEQELLCKSVESVSHPDDAEACVQHLRQSRSEGPNPPFETRAIRKQGEVIWVLLHSSPVRNASGRVLYYVQQIQDITARRRTEESLRHLAAIVEYSDDAIFGKDLDGVILSWNKGAEQVYGYSAGEVLGRPISLLMPPERSDELPKILAQIKQGIPVEHFETVRLRKDGQRIRVSITVSPILDYSGAVVGASATARDISARKRAEEGLRYLAATVEFSDDAIIGKNLDGVILTWNKGAERMYGYSADEVLGRSIYVLIPPERSDELPRIFEQIKQGEAVEHYETVRMRKDSRRIHVSITVSPIRDDGRIVGASTIARDITARKQTEEAQRAMEEQLRQAQKLGAVGLLAGGVAHNFNNLLGVVIGRSELLLGRLPPGAAGDKDLELIQEACQRAAVLTKQLLAFSSKQAMQPVVLDLNKVVTDTRVLMRQVVREDITVTTALDPKLRSVKADPMQIEQALLNLVLNARDAMPKGGALRVETGNVFLDEAYANNHAGVTPGPYAALVVSDTGCGMSKEVQAHLFEPFFTTKQSGKGTGLGLASTYGIVKQSGGHIEVLSAPDQGTTFKIYLPQVQEAPLPLSGEAQPALPRGNETIVLVEDEDELRTVARAMLESAGYRVLTANNGAEALQTCEEHKGQIHLLLTDVVMPKMNGTELAQRLERLQPGLKVVFMSGYADEAGTGGGVVAPDVHLMQKPFTSRVLARKVREVLDQR